MEMTAEMKFDAFNSSLQIRDLQFVKHAMPSLSVLGYFEFYGQK